MKHKTKYYTISARQPDDFLKFDNTENAIYGYHSASYCGPVEEYPHRYVWTRKNMCQGFYPKNKNLIKFKPQPGKRNQIDQNYHQINDKNLTNFQRHLIKVLEGGKRNPIDQNDQKNDKNLTKFQPEVKQNQIDQNNDKSGSGT